MKSSVLLRVKEFCVSKAIAIMLLVSLGLSSGAFGAYLPPTEGTILWREFMSVLQREASQTSGPRLYLMTNRVIEQTSADTAQFQSGNYRMILADGSAPDVDGDVDGYTDVMEDNNEYANRDDPTLIPLGPPPGNKPLKPDVLKDAAGNWFPIYMADGTAIGVADSITTANTKATYVAPQAGINVRVTSAPASALKRPVAFTDFSSVFYYYYKAAGQTTGEYLKFPLSLYSLRQDYLNPQDCNTLETTIVPGVYSVEYPTVQNPPYGKGAGSVSHRLVPNGSLTIGLKKPTWLLRSLTSAANFTSAPVPQSWVNGRLTFDPYLTAILNWDNLNISGLAWSSDYIEIWIENDAGIHISYTERMSAVNASVSINNSAVMNTFYGTIKSHLGSAPLSVSGHIVMQYSRYANGKSTADLSTVTVRVPVQMTESYASWRQAWFPNTLNNDSISGPDADPDGDGLTNQQEYEQGSNPLQATIAINTPSVTDITNSSATLGATVENDPYAAVPVTVLERGVVYAATAVNPDPLLNGPGVLIIPDPAATAGVFAVPVTELDAETQYSFRGYLITDIGIYYTTPVTTFNTLILPTITSPTSTNITMTTAVLGGTVTSGGDTTITARGVVYSSTNPDPLLTDSVATTTGTTGVFTVPVTGLAMGTTYWFKAYVTNSAGTSYTSDIGSFTTPATLPTLAPTPAYANRTATTVTLGGNVTSNGGSPLSECGVVYAVTSTNNNPMIGGLGVSQLAIPGVTGVFTVPVAGLTPGTTYSFRAYATNGIGTTYSSQVTSFTTYTTPTVTSPAVTNLTSTTVTLGGTVTSNGNTALTQRGVIYSTDPTMTVGITTAPAAGTATGSFTVPIVGLTPGTNYYFQAYATNSVGTTYTTSIGSFITPVTVPVVTSPTKASIAATTATLGGNVTSNGGMAITAKGVVYSATNSNPELGGSDVTAVAAPDILTGVFTVPVTTLTPGLVYYFKAYATNSLGAGYTTVANFTTQTTPTVTSPSNRIVTATTATLGGTVTSDGGPAITERGVVYSLTAANPNPLIGGAGVTQLTTPGTTGVFEVAPITGLTAGTSYSFKAYAINSSGTSYSDVKQFTTLIAPTVTTPTSSGVTGTTATLGGNVTSDGGWPITERGVVYSSTNIDPLIAGSGVTKVATTGTTGVFTVGVTGLAATTTYYFKAYAINSGGTTYTTVASFITLTPPSMADPTIANLTASTVTLGGNVTSAGDAAIIERGVVYSLTTKNSDPLIGGTLVTKVVAAGTTTGVFTVDVTGLTAKMTYSFKAYAITSSGTSYTPGAMFTTPTIPTVTTPTVTGLTATTATLGSSVTSDGGAPITVRGIIYSVTAVNSDPLLGGAGVTSLTSLGTIGAFAVPATGLTPATAYTFKAYATNSAGTAYSSSWAFFTTFTAPALAATPPTSAAINATAATLGGNVTNDGGKTITERGVVYSSTNIDPLIDGIGVTKAITTGTTGVFTVAVGGLTANTTYYFKSYALNVGGVTYSPVASFTTLAVPIVLGRVNLQWVAATGSTTMSMSGTTLATAAQTIPEIAYEKASSEVAGSMAYQIEMSLDAKSWLPLDNNCWNITESPTTLRARWNSPTISPPSHALFRIGTLNIAQ